MNSSNLNIKPKLINQGKNENGNLWFQFVLPNRQYAFIYKNTNGELDADNLYKSAMNLNLRIHILSNKRKCSLQEQVW